PLHRGRAPGTARLSEQAVVRSTSLTRRTFAGSVESVRTATRFSSKALLGNRGRLDSFRSVSVPIESNSIEQHRGLRGLHRDVLASRIEDRELELAFF